MARPKYKPTAATRRKVEEWLSCGMPIEKIGRVLQKDADTIRKHFKAEIEDGAAKRHAEAITLLYKQARKGNMAAIRRLEERTSLTLTEQGINPQAAEPAAEKMPRATKQGKKEVAQSSAETAGVGSEWANDLVSVAVVPPKNLQN